ncbi:2-hydroxy-7-methoxy-5-methyl-1-naphthoate--CoA ligase-like isoform X2 [Littorina saxatilis]|uniref:2-hydroxy-7-methoxy-5-methyl-1-naphthoate--CoA ligase-like isoform X2 n=1 Tax=Littorina saxatilis TaxID=31220 RepID=UPI0038B62414
MVLEKVMAAVPGHTVEELIHHWSLIHPDTEAFVSYAPDTHERRSLTRNDVHVLSRKFAAKLRQFGVGKGDVVCVSLPNCLERVVADFGTICSGAIALNGQVFRADGEDLIHAINISKAKAVVLDPTSTTGAWAILKKYVTELDCDVKCDALPHLRRVISCRRNDANLDLDFFTDLRDFNKSLQRAHALTSDVAVIWTTSGSTGYSKLVPQTHENLTHIALQVLHISGLRGGERLLNCAPLGWAGGFPLWFLASGATRVFVDTRRGPPRDMAAALWECVQREKCVYVFASPMYVSSILERPELWQEENHANAVWKPRGICIAGQPMKRFVVAAAGGRLCEHIDINYGTTECGVIATTRVTDPDTFFDGVTGRAAPGTEIRVVDEGLNDVGMGETGEILARNPALYGKYLDNEEAARRAFTQDGWFRTDDVGYFLPDRQLVHLGRRCDVITRGAYLCYPGWLETLLRRAPGVRDVCVVPVPDPVLHHEICACVVPAHLPPPADFEASLRSFADSQLLTQPGDSQHMIPKYYVTLPSLSLTPTGKISRREVGELARKELGLFEQ